LPIFNPFNIWLSILFSLIIVLILLIPMFIKKNFRTIVNNKQIV
jgi:hypothetical protein